MYVHTQHYYRTDAPATTPGPELFHGRFPDRIEERVQVVPSGVMPAKAD